MRSDIPIWRYQATVAGNCTGKEPPCCATLHLPAGLLQLPSQSRPSFLKRTLSDLQRRHRSDMSQFVNQNYAGVGARDSSTQINGNIHDGYYHNQTTVYAQSDRPLRIMTAEEQVRKNTALIQVVKDKRKRRVEHLLRAGADVDASDEHDLSALHRACKLGATEIIDMLVNRFDADVDAANEWQITPLYMAAAVSQEAAVQMLLQHRPDIDGPEPSPLNAACKRGHLSVVKLLIQAGISASLARPEVSVIEYLTKRCVSSEETKLLARFANAQPLHLAAAGGHCELVAYLLDMCGVAVDPTCTIDWIDASLSSPPQERRSLVTEESWTPLLLTDCTPCARILLDRGANVNHCCLRKGITRAMAATTEGDQIMLSLLIEYGADLGMMDATGRTFVDRIIARRKEDRSRRLLHGKNS